MHVSCLLSFLLYSFWILPGSLALTCNLIEIEHGNVILDSYDVGSVARFECDRGYELEGSSTLLCLIDGSWSNPLRPPTCTVIFCPELPEHPHLIRFQASNGGAFNDYLSVVTNRCEQRYQLVGSETNICQADKTWSGEPASCERINCGHPNIGSGTARILSHTFYAGEALIECHPGHMLVGSSTAICTENGWVGGYCYGNCTVGPITHGHAAATVLREGDVLQWQCNTNGYAKYPGDRETVCHHEALVPPPQCRMIEYGPEGCPAETDDIRVTRHRDTCLIFHLTELSSFDTAQETCRNHFNGRMLTIRDSIKMDFVASVLSGLVIEMNSGTFFDILSNRVGVCGHYKAWLGLSYSDQWRWPALLGEPVSYTRWRAGQGGVSLTGIKFEKCATLNGGHGWWWDDVLCGCDNYVVCETSAFY